MLDCKLRFSKFVKETNNIGAKLILEKVNEVLFTCSLIAYIIVILETKN